MKSLNTQRARRFGDLLRGYDTDDTDDGRLTDLLTDARHWCDLSGQNYAEHDRIAYSHYVAEVGEERQP